MKELDGVETAKLIRKKNTTAEIIFVTSHPDFVFQGYEVRALNYILKPYEETVVDFIAIGNEGEEYYQVAYTVIGNDGKTLEREFKPLEAINGHNPKYLLTMDFTPFTSHNGIKQINVLDWLLK